MDGASPSSGKKALAAGVDARVPSNKAPGFILAERNVNERGATADIAGSAGHRDVATLEAFFVLAQERRHRSGWVCARPIVLALTLLAFAK